MSNHTYDTVITYTTMQELMPVLALLDGYAMQHECVRSVTWADTHDARTGHHTGREIVNITFPHGFFKKVKGGWVLCINDSPVAIFPA